MSSPCPGVDPRATSYSGSLVIQLKYWPVLPLLNKVDYFYYYYYYYYHYYYCYYYNHY